MIHWIPNDMPKISYFCAVLGAFLIQMTLGGAFSYNYRTFNSSYSEQIKKEDTLQIFLMFALPMFAISTSMSLGGYMSIKYNPGVIVLVGGFIMSTGIALSTICKDNSKGMLLIFGLIGGLGGGVTFSVSLSIPCQYTIRLKGIILGISQSGFQLGAIIIQIIINKYETPGKVMPIGYTLCYVVITIGSALLIRRRSRESDYEADDYLLNTPRDDDLEPHKVIFEFDFLIMWLIFVLNCFGYYLIILYYEIFKLNYDSEYMSKLYFIYTSFNAVGRIFWGILFDCLNYRSLMTTITLGSTLLNAIVFLTFKPDIGIDKLTQNIIITIYNFWSPGYFTIITTLILKRFGKKYFACNCGLMWTANSVADVISSLCATYMIKNMQITLIICSVMSFISFLLAQFYLGFARRYDQFFYRCFC